MNSNDHTTLSIIIACYNEEPHLIQSVKEIQEVMDHTIYKYELIFIDDMSRDNTREKIKEVCKGKENYRYYFHEKNVGRGGTVREGLLMAKGKYAGFLDIDLEVVADYIPAMITALENNYDAAIAYRYYDILQFNGLSRATLSLCYRLLTRYYLKMNIHDTEAGYKFFNLETTRDTISKTKNTKWFWDTEIIFDLIKNGKKIKEIPCLFLRKKDKKSTVRLIPDIIDYMKAIIEFKKNN
jgi:glycosyltransferase involved in cell wall biosynthesis